MLTLGTANPGNPIVAINSPKTENFPENSTASDAYQYVSKYCEFNQELFAILVKETQRFSIPWMEKAEELIQLACEVEQDSFSGKEFVKNMQKKMKRSDNYPAYICSILLKLFPNYSANV